MGFDFTARRALSSKDADALEAEIDRLQRTYECALPASFLRFVREVGPGLYGGYHRIAGIQPRAPRGWDVFSLAAKLRDFREAEAQDMYAEEFGHPALFATLVPFASTLQGDQFLFDRAGRVAMIARLRPKFFRKVCDSFEGFLRYSVDGGFERTLGYDPGESEGPSFVPLPTLIAESKVKTPRAASGKKAAPRKTTAR